MGITKLMHIKNRNSGKTSKGLENAIYYIMNPDKTDNYNLVFSNSGETENEIYNRFLKTKVDYEKEDGRQGYHFVLSFSEDENVSDQKCMDIMRDFVDQYIKNNYDYVVAVHNDTKHKHGHLVFNSVNKETSFKYRYEKGDWEKYIQPITDRIAKKYGLKELNFTTYEEESKKVNWKEIIMTDIDECISSVKSYEEFIDLMTNRYHYQIREGTSNKYGLYFSYKPDGKAKAIRSYNLPIDYQPDFIKYRIEGGLDLIKSPAIKYNSKKAYIIHNKRKYIKWKDMTEFQKYKFKRLMKARSVYGSRNKRPNWEAKRIVNEMNKQSKELLFILNNNIDYNDVEIKIKDINSKLAKTKTDVNRIKKSFEKYIYGNPSIFVKYENYLKINNNKNKTKIQREFIYSFERDFDIKLISTLYNDYNNKILPIKKERQELYEDRKICNSILKNRFKKVTIKNQKTKENTNVKI